MRPFLPPDPAHVERWKVVTQTTKRYVIITRAKPLEKCQRPLYQEARQDQPQARGESTWMAPEVDGV